MKVVLLLLAILFSVEINANQGADSNRRCQSPNEVFQTCGPSCPPACIGVIKPGTLCSTECFPGCFCREGLVRTSRGTCVPPRACRSNQ
uniref:Venom protein n=1 Tax=Hadrurus spadix TaxID=141984 RepID=A0A1W7R974_9SCOR